MMKATTPKAGNETDQQNIQEWNGGTNHDWVLLVLEKTWR